MKKNFLTDYSLSFLAEVLGPLLRILPRTVSVCLGKMLGNLLYSLDLKHKSLAYANIRRALPVGAAPAEIRRVTRAFYQKLGQNLIDIFFIPLINQEYIQKYVTIEGLSYIHAAFAKGRGAILVTMHAGSWELASTIGLNLGLPVATFVRGQGYPRLNLVLNRYRSLQGGQLMQRDGLVSGIAAEESSIRGIKRCLQDNQIIAMTVDQGGKRGILVPFFGKEASMASGAVRLALKYGCALVPVFFTRVKGPYLKIIIKPAHQLAKTGSIKEDARKNLEDITALFENLIRMYPDEYLWVYKIWKYSNKRSILILNDGKTGHLRQSQTFAKILQDALLDRGVHSRISIIEISTKNAFLKHCLSLSALFAGNYCCQGCLWCLRKSLQKSAYTSLVAATGDIVVSCGSQTAGINFLISRENAAKSVVLMKPGLLSTRRFDLVIMPRHDNPPRRKNVVITDGSLNLIDAAYLQSNGTKLGSHLRLSKKTVLGCLIGGTTKSFPMEKGLMQKVFLQIKQALDRLDGEMLMTTSRRTPPDIEALVKEQFSGFARCKLLVIANEENIPEAVGGILALSSCVIVSGESISMVSEAASAGRYVVVFKTKMNLRHRRFLEHLASKQYIYLVEADDLGSLIASLYLKRPPIKALQDEALVIEKIGRVI
jgi:KDO2-lipid IV(A) lauroyltransferase